MGRTVRRPARRALPGRLVWAPVALAFAIALPGCAAPEPLPPDLPLARIEPMVRVELVEQPPGPAPRIWVRVLVEPPDERPMTLVPAGPGAGHAVLELRVHWQDFRGDGPTSSGHSGQSALGWTGSETAELGRPAVIAMQLELDAVHGALARRIDVQGRLIGVELRAETERSGGLVIPLPPTHLDSLAPAPGGTLESHLQSGSPSGIFLSAAGAPPAEREATLDRLIDALSSSSGRAREAILAALLYLTGETHGRDAHLWRTWWNEQRRQGHP